MHKEHTQPHCQHPKVQLDCGTHRWVTLAAANAWMSDCCTQDCQCCLMTVADLLGPSASQNSCAATCVEATAEASKAWDRHTAKHTVPFPSYVPYPLGQWGHKARPRCIAHKQPMPCCHFNAPILQSHPARCCQRRERGRSSSQEPANRLPVVSSCTRSMLLNVRTRNASTQTQQWKRLRTKIHASKHAITTDSHRDPRSKRKGKWCAHAESAGLGGTLKKERDAFA